MNNEVELRARIENWATRLKVAPSQLRLQRMRRKWASCSMRGRVTFCLDLLRQPGDFQDYVIVHELLHIRIRNHGKLFDATLRAYLPGNPWLTSPHVHDIDKGS